MNLFSLAAGFGALLGAGTETEIAYQILDYVEIALIPIMIIVGAAGIIYAIYLGVNLARADSADKRQEAKSRMINAIIGLVSIFVLILLMFLFIANIDAIFGGFNSETP